MLYLFILMIFQSLPPADPFATKIDTYGKIVAGVVAGLGFLFGLPVTIQTMLKTRAEIRKLDLEAKKLASENLVSSSTLSGGHKINIEGSHNSVTVLADPRLLSPLLLLLSFMTSVIMLILAEYALSFLEFLFGIWEPLRQLILALFAAVLFLPILREALSVKRSLKPEKSNQKENTAEDDSHT